MSRSHGRVTPTTMRDYATRNITFKSPNIDNMPQVGAQAFASGGRWDRREAGGRAGDSSRIGHGRCGAAGRSEGGHHVRGA